MKIKIRNDGSVDLDITPEEDRALGQAFPRSAVIALLATVLSESLHIPAHRWVTPGRPPPADVAP